MARRSPKPVNVNACATLSPPTSTACHLRSLAYTLPYHTYQACWSSNNALCVMDHITVRTQKGCNTCTMIQSISSHETWCSSSFEVKQQIIYTQFLKFDLIMLKEHIGGCHRCGFRNETSFFILHGSDHLYWRLAHGRFWGLHHNLDSLRTLVRLSKEISLQEASHSPVPW